MKSRKRFVRCLVKSETTVSREIFLNELQSVIGHESQRGIQRRFGIDRQHFSPRRHRCPRIEGHIVRKAAEQLELMESLRLLRLRWEPIEEITRLGVEHVYDLEVAEVHNFVANGIIVHNCVYQEQVMRIASDLANFSLAQADLLRRAMGKKIAEVMEGQRRAFLEGCRTNHIPERIANRIFDLMEHFAGYGFNKCVVGETELLDADTGERIAIEALYRHRRAMTTLSVGSDLRLVKRRVLDVLLNGPQHVFRVTTRLGHSITVTDNHPFLTVDGWKELKELRIGDFVATPRSLQSISNAPRRMEPYRLVVLAAILSEGNTCHPSGVYIYNNSEAFIDDFVSHVSQFELTAATVRKRGVRYEVYAGTGRQTTFAKAHIPWNKGRSGYSRSGLQGSFPNFPRSGVRTWIEELGLAWVKSTEKFIPEAIFGLSDDQLALFLGRLWSGDGHIWSKTGPHVPFYATSSNRLASQVQHLLLRLGMLSVVKRKQFRYRNTIRPGYTVYLTGRQHVLRFVDLVGPHVIGPAQSLHALRAYYESVERDRTSKDVIPSRIKLLVHEAKEHAGITWRQLEQRSGVCMKEFYGRVKSSKHGFRRSTIRRLAEYLESPELLRYATTDIYWDRIASIEARGLQDTYDVEIEDTHNFIANDLIVHNSHSAAYALISYRTAYLKTHYPLEFLAALLTSEMGNADKLVPYLDEARRTGIPVLPPDVNESHATFTVASARAGNGTAGEDRQALRCGLGIIKNVGMAAIESIVKARQAHGRFTSIELLCDDLDLRLVNRKVLESLIKAGACDSMGASRAVLLARLDRALDEAGVRQRDRSLGQFTLFDTLSASPAGASQPVGGSDGPHPAGAMPTGNLREWPESQKLAFEKAL
ncbi:MAG: hypothetical protein HYZ89_03395, partial [Candidatus Omnitrophica bacterium]|nr:hypothetical protein [Candidatus Omnitrophota bacterium]